MVVMYLGHLNKHFFVLNQNRKTLNQKKWIADPEGHPDFGWIGRPPALFKESSVTVNEGFMNIEVGKLDKDFVSNKYAQPATYSYYGGIIRASQPISYGNYFESRFKMSKTEMGGGFWLMSRNICDKKHQIDANNGGIAQCILLGTSFNQF